MEHANKPGSTIDLMQSFEEITELETFVHDLAHQLDSTPLKEGEDLIPHAKSLHIRIPDSFHKATLTYAGDMHETGKEKAGTKTIVLTIPNKDHVFARRRRTRFCIDVHTPAGEASICIMCLEPSCTIKLVYVISR